MRFSIQIVIISLLVFFEDLRINQLRILVIDDLLSNYLFNFILTTFCLAILVNGSNFIDGLNGLLSGYFLGVILSILYIVNNFENISFLEIDILKVLFFSLLIFYLFNIFGKVYLGDSGSYLLALIIGYLSIKLFYKIHSYHPIILLLSFGILLLKIYFLLIRRIKKKKKEISIADGHHLHQLLFKFLYKKKFLRKYNLNSISSAFILLYNLFIMILSTINYFHTKTLILLIVLNLFVYLSGYIFLSKNFKFKK